MGDAKIGPFEEKVQSRSPVVELACLAPIRECHLPTCYRSTAEGRARCCDHFGKLS